MVRAFILLAFCLVCAACGGGAGAGGVQGFTPPSGSRFIEGVPFFAEDSHQCGPASLAALMAFHGKPVSQGQVARAVYRPSLKGSLNLDLMLFARSKGLCAVWQSGGPQEAVSRISQGMPMLVLVDYGLGPVKKLHYMVLTGCTPKTVRVNSGLRQGLHMPWPDFLPAWQRTGYAFLDISLPLKGACP